MAKVENIEYSRGFLKKLARLPKRILVGAEAKERLFRENAFHPSLDTHKLHGKDKDAWAFSIDRKYRIKFLFITDSHVIFLDVGTHDMYE